MQARVLLAGLLAAGLVQGVQGCGSSKNPSGGATVALPGTPVPGAVQPTNNLGSAPASTAAPAAQPAAPSAPSTTGMKPATPPPTTTTPPATGMAGAAAPAPTSGPPTGPLMAPAAGEGIQIATTVFTLNPGQEVFRCYHASIPVDGEINVARWESQMPEGSHHFILYKNDGDTTPEGTLDNNGCTLGFNQNWIFSSAQLYNELKMPQGVAMTLGSRQKVVFDMHYINATQQPQQVNVVLNVHLAKGTFEKAASLTSFNSGIFIPPMGTQTVTGTCTPGNGAKFFLMTTHTHKHGMLATINRLSASGQVGEELVRTPDWGNPTIKHFDPTFVTFQPGEQFQYQCVYQNDSAQTVTVGTSVENEMCMAITYYFPASAGGSCM